MDALEIITNEAEARNMFVEGAGGNTRGWRRNLSAGQFAWVIFGEGQEEGPVDAAEWSFGIYDAEGDEVDMLDALTFAGAMDAVDRAINEAR